MLVISRKLEEGVRIGDNVEIKILDVYATDGSGSKKSKSASIGISAPREISILRRELYDTQNANKDAVENVVEVSSSELATLLGGKKEKAQLE